MKKVLFILLAWIVVGCKQEAVETSKAEEMREILRSQQTHLLDTIYARIAEQTRMGNSEYIYFDKLNSQQIKTLKQQEFTVENYFGNTNYFIIKW